MEQIDARADTTAADTIEPVESQTSALPEGAHRPVLEANVVNRLARNRADDVMITLTIKQAGARLISCSENIDDTPSGMLTHGIMSSIAEFYSANLATEAKKGIREKAKRGGTPFRAPFGYRNIVFKDEQGREVRTIEIDREVRTIEIDPERAEAVRWIFITYNTGNRMIRQLADELERRGIRTRATPDRPARPLKTSNVHDVLKNRYYLGFVSFEGVEYEGKL